MVGVCDVLARKVGSSMSRCLVPTRYDGNVERELDEAQEESEALRCSEGRDVWVNLEE